MDIKVLSVILISVICAGITSIIARLAYASGEINPLSYSMNVLLITIIFFSAFTVLRKEPIRGFSKPIWLRLFVLSILATAVGMGIYFMGINYTTAINTSFITRLQVPFTAMFAFFMIGDRLTRRQIWATILMLTGGYSIMFGFDLIVPNFGDLLILSSSVLFGFTHTYFKKELAHEVSLFTVLFYRSWIGVGLLAISVFIALREVAFQALTTVPHFVVLQAAAYSFYVYGLYYGIKKIGPGPTTIFFLIAPLITVSLAFIVLKETMVATQGIGAALILMGSYLIIKNKAN